MGLIAQLRRRKEFLRDLLALRTGILFEQRLFWLITPLERSCPFWRSDVKRAWRGTNEWRGTTSRGSQLMNERRWSRFPNIHRFRRSEIFGIRTLFACPNCPPAHQPINQNARNWGGLSRHEIETRQHFLDASTLTTFDRRFISHGQRQITNGWILPFWGDLSIPGGEILRVNGTYRKSWVSPRCARFEIIYPFLYKPKWVGLAAKNRILRTPCPGSAPVANNPHR